MGGGRQPTGASGKIRAFLLRLTGDGCPEAGPVPVEGMGARSWPSPLEASHWAQLYFLFVNHAGDFSLLKVLAIWGFDVVGCRKI